MCHYKGESMTNEELKKKIAQIIADYFCPQGNEHKKLWGDDRLCYSKMNFAECEWVTECTDALIAAGVGEVEEAEHCTARAEMALKKFAENITCEDCPVFSDCESSEKMEDLIHSKYCFSEYLKQEEKELAEEGKDGIKTD